MAAAEFELVFEPSEALGFSLVELSATTVGAAIDKAPKDFHVLVGSIRPGGRAARS